MSNPMSSNMLSLLYYFSSPQKAFFCWPQSNKIRKKHFDLFFCAVKLTYITKVHQIKNITNHLNMGLVLVGDNILCYIIETTPTIDTESSYNTMAVYNL